MSIKHTTEFVLLRIFTALVRCLPLSLAYWLMERVTMIAHSVFGWRKQSTQQRISEVCTQRSAEEQTWIRKEAVRNLGRNLTELIRPGALNEITIEGQEETFDMFHHALEKGKGMLLVIMHSGNWDLAGVRTVREGFPVCFIARQQKNPLTYHLLVKTREQSGGTVVDRDDPRLIRKLLGFLAENGIVAVLVDIRARQAGDTFQYLSQEAWLANGLGLLAAKSGAEVVPVYLGRKGRNTHVWKPKKARRLEAEHSGKTERYQLLQSCLDDFSEEIEKNPESYFWFNKRWVLETFKNETE